MGPFFRLFLTIVVIYFSKMVYQFLYEVPPLPNIPEKNYWGPGKAKPDDVSIRPFQINISDSVLTDLRQRLKLDLKRITPSLEGTNFEYGFHSDKLKEVVKFWLSDEYRWREREANLNSLPQFKTQISGLDVHFIHAKPKNVPKTKTVVPLLLVHGWPGSVKEFHKLIPLLTAPDNKDLDIIFEVISPSLPGYAFSEGSHKPGLSPAHMAAIFRQLMLRLGHSKFYVQGGDWGSLITANLAQLYPENVIGLHSNMCGVNSPAANVYLMVSSLYPSLFMDKELSDKLFPLSDVFSNLVLEMGYMHIQATKPDTVGVALSNSPAGLAAYILEKFSTWTSMDNRNLRDGGLTRKFSLADLLDNVMLYWTSGSITSSMRLYSEAFNKEYQAQGWDSIPIQVPSFCARFPNELINQPDFIIRLKYPKLLPTSRPEPNTPLHLAGWPLRGGHFAAFEEPSLMAASIFHGVQLIKDTLEAKAK